MNKPKKSNKKNKKFMIETPKGKTIHFGDSRYEDFTQHKDKKRQKNYCKRAMGIKDKKGNLTYKNPESPNYYSVRLLWNCL
tara:strand:+ start:549 stop:791 length:243 start_codon:yes stop_codon:yes gene_type:complete